MKKLITMGLLLLPVALVAAVSLTTDNLNSAMIETLARFQSKDSKIGVEFSEIKTSAKSIEKLKLKGWLWRNGSHNLFDLKLNNFDYEYKKGKKPTLAFNGELNLDLIKALGLDEVNEIAESLEEMVQTYSEEYLEKYGSAATVSSEIINYSKDAKGNYESLTAVFTLDLDYKNLPADVKIEDVELQKAEVTISLTTKSAAVHGSVVFNPKFLGFADQASGLKIELEKLSERDDLIVRDIQVFTNAMLYFIDDAISQDNSK